MNKKRRKILFVCTEDWFFYSHFLPLVKAAKQIDDSEIVLATTIGGKHLELEKLGVRLVPVEFDRASVAGFSAVRLLLRMISLFHREKSDIIHFIALKPVLIGGLAALFARTTGTVCHVTGLGTLAEGGSRLKKLLAAVIFKLPVYYHKRSRATFFFENPDDLRFFQNHGLGKTVEVDILGGAGIDPQSYPPQIAVDRAPVRIAFIGRMIWTKGVDILVEAMDLVGRQGIDITADLYGDPDPANPGSYSQDLLEEWGGRQNVSWHGYSNDIVGIWQRADICVISTRTREGMPRAMLEAASCARPLIVTDVPGCRHFVRDGVEGFVVPPEDPAALAKAIATLAQDAGLRKRMGRAARARVLDGYTEQDVIDQVVAGYRRILAR